jgi:hypothetical protein
MIPKKIRLTLLFLCSGVECLYAQNLLKGNQYSAGGGVFVSSAGKLPFLMHANQFGERPTEQGTFAQFKATVHHEYDSLYTADKKLLPFGWGYGGSLVLNSVKSQQTVVLSEAYAKVRWKSFEFYGGRRKEIVGLADTTLTSGSYSWSGNALPLPKLQISIPEYTPIVKNGLISLKGAFAHGWFDANRPITENVKLHQKWLYFRLGKPEWKIKTYAGFNHQVQWGGKSPYHSIDGKLPQRFSDYIHVVTGKRNPDETLTDTVAFENNRIGNHLGTVDIAVSYDFSTVKLSIYRQNIYEDGSLFFLNNITDGLNSLSLEFKTWEILKRFTVEYLNTYSQGGPYFIGGKGIPGALRGKDNYFNHAQYVDGWVYKGQTIGTPYIQSLKHKWDSNYYVLDNNRIKMIHLAFAGVFPGQINYLFRASFSNNFGSYAEPLPLTRQTSYQLRLEKFMNNQSSFRIETGFDRGELITNAFAINASWIKQWN